MSALLRLARGEILRARSGSSFVLLLSYVVIVPVYGLMLTGTLDSLGRHGDEAATRIVFAFVATSALAAGFYGAYAFTRETYYHSLDRTLLLGPRDAIVLAKAAAGAVSGLLFGLVAVLVWSIATAIVLALIGHTFAPDPTFPVVATGTLLACGICGALGTGAGYLLRNYYLTIPVLLVLPAAVTVPLLTHARDIARFSPIGAVAGLADAPIEGLLAGPLAALVLIGWAAAVVGLALIVERRRAAR